MNIADARMKDRASLTAQDSQGNTALILATKNICGDSMNSFEIVKMLVSSNIISSPKALKIAAQCWPQCPKDIFDFYVGSFLSNDINDINDISVINIQNNMGNTALMYAAKCKDYGIVKHLIANGADTTLKNNLDQTAFELAPDGPVKGLLRRQPH